MKIQFKQPDPQEQSDRVEQMNIVCNNGFCKTELPSVINKFVFHSVQLITQISVDHGPLQAAGGIPMQMKYCKVSMQARKQQYLGQISAIAFLRRLYITTIRAKA